MDYWTAKRLRGVKATNIPDLIEKGVFTSEQLFITHKVKKTAMNQWKFNPQEGDNAVSDNDEIVFYIDDLNPEVVAKIVEIQNQGIEIQADFVPQVDAYLAQEDRCSPDEREFVMEQINNYVKINATPAETIANAQPQQPAAQGSPAAEEKPGETQTPQGGNTGGTVNNDDAGKPGVQQQQPQASQRGGNRRGQQAAAGATTTRRTTTGGAKVESTEELIKSLQDKIDLIKLIDTAQIIEVPAGLGKTARDIMTEFQKEQEALKLSYMERVKTM